MDWIGVPLPIRESSIPSRHTNLGGYVTGMDVNDPTRVKANYPSESVIVEFDDAVKALRLARCDTAAAWWENWYKNRHQFMGSKLIFQSVEGKLLTPDDIQDRLPGLPGISDFDETVVPQGA